MKKEQDLLHDYILIKYFLYDGEKLIDEMEKFQNGQYTVEYITELIKKYDNNAKEVHRIVKEIYDIDLIALYDGCNNNEITGDNILHNHIKQLITRIDNLDINPILFSNISKKANTILSDSEKDSRLIEYMDLMKIDDVTDYDLREIDKKLNKLNSNISVQEYINKEHLFKNTNELNVSQNNNHLKNIKAKFKIKYKIKYVFTAILCMSILLSGLGVIGNEIYKVIKKNNDNIVKFGNEQNFIYTTDEDYAYQRIYDELGIRPIKLNDNPEELDFISLDIDSDTKTASMRFEYNGKKLSLIQSLSNSELAEIYVLDGYIIDNIKIKNLDNNLDIYEYIDEYNNHQYLTSMEIRNNFYVLSGNIDKDTFKQIVENIIFYKYIPRKENNNEKN